MCGREFCSNTLLSVDKRLHHLQHIVHTERVCVSAGVSIRREARNMQCVEGNAIVGTYTLLSLNVFVKNFLNRSIFKEMKNLDIELKY
jgi:hypothetical protein